MIRKLLCMMIALILLAACAQADGDILYVDNRETDKVYPERLNLRSEPSRDGGLLGLYYSGTAVEVLGEEEGYKKVSVGGVAGYMAGEYLISMEEAEERYGDPAVFLAGREAQVDLGGLWRTEEPLCEKMGDASTALMQMKTGDAVQLHGITGDWAYVSAAGTDGRLYGYLPLETLVDVDERRVLIVAGKKADSQTNLYEQPADGAPVIMALKNGTCCLSVFGRSVGQWRKVRVGGVTGWIRHTQTENLVELGTRARNVVPYYPLIMQVRSEALLHNAIGIEDTPYMTLGEDMLVEVLAESGEWVYVRTLEGGAGSSRSGDYGYMKIDDLTLAEAGTGYGVAQVDRDDLPGLLYAQPDAQAAPIGALCCGAQVRIKAFTQTDYVLIEAADMEAYIRKADIRVIGMPEDPLSERIPQRAVVRESASLRMRPEANAAKGADIEAGQRVYVLGKSGEWALVLAEDTYKLNPEGGQERMGFVPLYVVSAPASTVHLSAMVHTDKVNLRETPDAAGGIIGRIRLEERLLVTDYGKQWTGVYTPDGKRGYVKTEYLIFD